MRPKKNSSDWESRTLDFPLVLAGQAVKLGGAKDRIREVLDRVLHRRHAGEFVADDEVITQHPELMPELAEDLRALEGIRRAFLAAQKAGPISEPLRVLSMDELEAPIDEDVTADPDDVIRVRISGYTITDEVNHGGQATVYKAIQESTGRKVAVKVVYGVHSRARVRIDREAEILVALDHPNVVGILDRGRTADGSFFIAMDFVEGYSLDEFLDATCPAGPKDLAELIRLFIKICNAIGYAHEKGVLHRDLKPSNIRVDLRGEPHILDFGLARLIKDNDLDGVLQHSITASGQLVGSLPWCSPEQAAGKQNDLTIRSDVYSLGLMLYQAVAGEAPYANRGLINEVVNNILHVAPKPIAGIEFARWGIVSDKLQSILFRCLEKVAEKRIASAGELAGELEDLLLHPGPSIRVAAKSKLRSRSGWATIAAVLIVGTVLTVTQMTNRPRNYQKQQGLLIDNEKPVELVNGRPIYQGDFGLKLVYCPPGRFEMGIKPNEVGYNRDEAAHWVPINKGFYISTLELTQRQYTQVIPNRVLSELYPGPDLPMASARWVDADQFCRELSARTNKRYRLPTEAEWEYACRAGSTGNFGGSDDLNDVGWYLENTPPNMMPRGGTKLPNAWKIYDMHGSVWEWCSDDFTSYFPATDDPRTSSKPQKVFRGGDITTSWEMCRSGSRKARQPDQVMHFRIGIRVVLEAEDAK